MTLTACPARTTSPVLSTTYTIKDSNGRPLCHAPSGDKARMNSKGKRAVREAFEAMCREAGMVTRNGRWTCAVTGVTGYRNTEGRQAQVLNSERDDVTMLALIDAGHVIPDEDGGAYCPCNLVPQVRASNLDSERDGNARLVPATFPGTDPRTSWRAVWERTAKASKVAAAV